MEKLKSYVAARGLTETARSLGVSAQRLSNWIERGVPIDKCPAIERITAGVVSRRDLRPNDWQDIWPELATQVATREASNDLRGAAANAYAKFSPSATLQISITNPALLGKFKAGEKYYVDFTPADEQAKAQ